MAPPTELRQRASAASTPNGAAPPPRPPQGSESLPTLLDPATCVRKGLCPVTALRGKEPTESHALYYEMHGDGPERVVLIMGLNGSFLGWVRQVEQLSRARDAATGAPRYTVLVFDNRGAGNSGTPRGPYATRGMAADVVALLDFVGWTARRGVHVVGISLGGMIAQEISGMIPERIASLVLAVTTAGGPIWSNFPPWYGLFTLTRLLFMSDRAKKVPIIVEMLFAQQWLDASADDDAAGRTNREVQCEEFLRRMNHTRTQQPLGAVSQMWAALTHSVSAARLRAIAEHVPFVVIVTGDEDHLVDPANSAHLARCMPGAELVRWSGTGHAVQLQRAREFCALVERAVEEGRRRGSGAGASEADGQ